MGTQFWWFFDAAAAVIVLIAVFIAGKRGFSKSIVVSVGCILGIIFSASISGGAAGAIYKTTAKPSNVKDIEHALEDFSITGETKIYIETLGYNVKVKEEKLTEIFAGGGDINAALYKYINNINGRTVDTEEAFNEKMTDGFARIMDGLLSSRLTAYAGAKAAEKIKADMPAMTEVIQLLTAEENDKAALKIEKEFTGEAYQEIIQTMCLVIVLLIFMVIVKSFAVKLEKSGAIAPMGDIAEHVLGAAAGIISGVTLVAASAAVIRACVLLGNSSMMLFNTETIDKTIFFKYIYRLVSMI